MKLNWITLPAAFRNTYASRFVSHLVVAEVDAKNDVVCVAINCDKSVVIMHNEKRKKCTANNIKEAKRLAEDWLGV